MALSRGRGVPFLVSCRSVIGPRLEMRLLGCILEHVFHSLSSLAISDVEQTGRRKAVCSIWRAPQGETTQELFVK